MSLTPSTRGVVAPLRYALTLVATSISAFVSCQMRDSHNNMSSSLPMSSGTPFLRISRTPAQPLPGQDVIAGVIAEVSSHGYVRISLLDADIGRTWIEYSLEEKHMRELSTLLEAITKAAESTSNHLLQVDVAAHHVMIYNSRGVVNYSASVTAPGNTSITCIIEFLRSKAKAANSARAR